MMSGTVEGPGGGDPGRAARFEAAVDALVAGDLDTLRSLVRNDRALVHMSSRREHGATLLHYVAANGVEDSRQRTPANAVAVAGFLLDSGASVDSAARTYGGGSAQTTLNLLVSSVHPALAGVQEPLVELLLDHGAAIDGPDDDGSPLMTALSFGYLGAAETLVRRGARVDNIAAAAALGRNDLVDRYFGREGTVKPSLLQLHWVPLPRDPGEQAGLALIWACAFGRSSTALLLLDRGVRPSVHDRDDMTPLHWAAANRHLGIVELLLDRGAATEARNRWGGTVLDSTAWFVMHGTWFPGESATSPREQRDREYAAVFEALIAAGADVAEVHHPTGHPIIDSVLARHHRDYAGGERGSSGGADGP